MNHLTVSQLVAARINVQTAIHDMNDVTIETNIYLEDALASMDNAMDFLDDLVAAAQKEQNLVNENATLRSLYAEYTTVRDLIGSEESCM